MIKIAFITDSLGIGGTEKSLVELVNVLPENLFDISIFSLGCEDEIVNQFERKIKIVAGLSNVAAANELKRSIKKGEINKSIQILFAIFFIKVLRALRLESTHLYKTSVVKLMNQSEEKFDYSVFYSLPVSIGTYYARMNIMAKQYYSWVHMDVCAYPHTAIKAMNRIYRKYDKIYCVSEHCRRSFLKLFPKMKNKTNVFYNILNYTKIKQLSEQNPGVPILNNKVTLFTCARVSAEKRPEWAIAIAEKLKQEGVDFVWYWAGGGLLYDEIRSKIVQNNLQEELVLLGNVQNPYPYYRRCDAYVQLSEHESYCISLAEATMLSKRIISTDFPTAFEITKDHSCVKLGHSQNEITEAIIELLDKEIIEKNGMFPISPPYSMEASRLFSKI